MQMQIDENVCSGLVSASCQCVNTVLRSRRQSVRWFDSLLHLLTVRLMLTGRIHSSCADGSHSDIIHGDLVSLSRGILYFCRAASGAREDWHHRAMTTTNKKILMHHSASVFHEHQFWCVLRWPSVDCDHQQSQSHSLAKLDLWQTLLFIFSWVSHPKWARVTKTWVDEKCVF